MNSEGGSRNLRFATRRTDSDLGRPWMLVRSAEPGRDCFFLRAECLYNGAPGLESLTRYLGE